MKEILMLKYAYTISLAAMASFNVIYLGMSIFQA